ncbi:sigma-70 family RNA polymerase sigma factor [Rhodococcus sp. Z13]|uniref:Sigma-70 family RNA polymerase sigma factor n=1 Tax=Rhodococcus sacchari TaxID=2962047 RepID=A0ACD4DFB1_9NOCA|nr:sigma-70 family RNA polymerase sigma factor [Rhodococcus sp. Z13]UYP18764.1 sigma-70 family RNA polymerase sigma factor [Rhodococcus sp. Z13]
MNETELVERCRTGDRAAFAELIAPSRQRVWAICMQITGNRHDAEDALQDALIAAWKNLDKFRGTSAFGTWLYRIASNASLTVGRRRRGEVLDEQIDLDHAAGGSAIADSVADGDAVFQALSLLPEQFRVAIVLREYARMSYREIADHQGVGVQTVKSRIGRARTQLVELLSPVLLGAEEMSA